MYNRKADCLCRQKRYKSNTRILIDVCLAEYDITQANISVLADRKIITPEDREFLSELPKLSREVTIGKWMSAGKIKADDVANGIADAKSIFMEANGFEDNDIFLIDNDALFILNRGIASQLRVGEFTAFRLDNVWTSYLRLSNNIELFYQYDRMSGIETFRAKGLGSSTYLHEKYMNEFIKEVFCIAQNQGLQKAINFVQEFYQAYQSRTIDIGFYRRYCPDSYYHVNMETISGATFYMDEASPYQIKDLDITYNAGIIREFMSLLTSEVFKRTRY